MPGFNAIEMDDVHTPSSDYSFSQPGLMPSSGMFPFSHTAPADLSGTAWDATVEGPQNYPEYPEHGAHDSPDFSFPSFEHQTPKGEHMHTMDDFSGKWPSSSVADSSVPEPKRRKSKSPSGSSSSSSKHKTLRAAAASKDRARNLSAAVHRGGAAPQLSGFEASGNTNALAFHEDAMTRGRLVDPNQFLLPESQDGMPVGPLFPGLMQGMGEGLSFGEMGAAAMQHVDPMQMHMDLDFAPSLASNSPPQVWDAFSRKSSPDFEDAWSLHLATSPTATTASASPPFQAQSPSSTRKHGAQMSNAEDFDAPIVSAISDDFSLPPAFGSRRPSSDGETARDHPLYKQAASQADGLFHCPWEGQASCNHKPEKLKCNYDKFVDSHLKPYRCKHESCENARFSSTACLLRHEREAHAMHGHGDKPYLCTYEGCDRALPGNGFPRQWNLKDHMRRVHDAKLPAAPVAPASPPAASSQQTKSRKKKKDSESSSSARKAAKINAAAIEAAKAEDAAAASHAEWLEHREALARIVAGLGSPDDMDAMMSIQEAQAHVAAMGKISSGLMSVQNADLLERPYARSFISHSG